MKKLHVYLLGALLIVAANSKAELLLIQESFGGLGTANLNTDTADTFDSAITTAGGSSSWNADTLFKANGDVAGTSDGSEDAAAFLNLGSYIDDSKGSTTGLFTFEATFETPGFSGSWMSLGLFLGGQTTDNNFTGTDEGVATSIIRDSNTDEVDYFGGPDTAGSPTSGPAFTGSSVTFTTVLDLRTYDGISDFGSVSFFKEGSGTADFTYDYLSANTFQQIGFSVNNGADSVVSDFSLTQIPEPSSIIMLGLSMAAMLILGFRKRR